MDVISTVRKNSTGEEVLVFEFDEPVEVALTNESGVNDLKCAFRKVLQELIADDVTFSFKRDEGMENNLFVQACEEYVKCLNEEIKATRMDMVQKGIAEPSGV